MEIIEALEKFGLSKKEAQTYLTNLELGTSTANDISIKSNLPRTLVYDLLERLINLGLASYTIKNNKKYFTAESPKELLRIIKEKEQAIKKIIPQLGSLHKLQGSKRPKVTIYEGKEGMKTMMNEMLTTCGKEFWGLGSSRASWEIIPGFMEDWHKRRIKMKVAMNVIYNNTKESKDKIKKFKHTLRYTNFKLLPIDAPSPTATVFYSNKVVLQSWTKDPFAVVIESKQMAENHKKYFEELWKIAKS